MDADRRALTVAAPSVGPAAVAPRLTPRWLSPSLAAVPVAFLVIFYAWPVATLLGEVADAGRIGAALRRPGLSHVVWFTCWQAVVSTLATVAVGLAPTYLVSRWQFAGRRLVLTLITVPFLLPTVVVGAAFAALLPDRLHGTALAVVVAHVFFNVAVVVRIVGAVWSQLPHDLTSAARTLGAGPWQAMRLITLPLLRPAIVAAAAITFLFTFTSFGVVQVLGGPANPTIEVEIARRATQLGDVGGAAVLSAMQLLVLVVLIAVTARTQRSTTQLSLRPVARRRPPTARLRRFVGAGAAATLVMVLLPLAGLVTDSFRPGGQWSLVAWRTLGDTSARPGAGLSVDPLASVGASLRIAVVATVISLIVGALATLAIAGAGRRGKLIDVGMMLPLGTSAVTVGFGMLITFDHAPVDWRGQWWLVPLGHALVAAPFVVRTMLAVLRARPTGWIEAASTLGASPLRAWWHIDVMMLRRPVVTAAGFAAAISLGEFGATTFLTRTGDETLPVAIARLLGRAGDIPRAQGSALAVVLAAVTLAILIGVDLLDRDLIEGEGPRALDVAEVVVEFGDRVVLNRVSLHVERGEVVALQGPSGSGKSTLLRVIAGLQHPRSGAVCVDGRNIVDTPVHRRGIGLVFQDDQLFPHLDVAGNVAFGLRMARQQRPTRDQRIRDVLQLVGLAGFESRSVTSLSGGEAKRVALARSLAPAPPVLLLDEPLTGLDDQLHDRLADDLAQLLRATGTTALMVTHDRAEAQAVADRVVTLDSISGPTGVDGASRA